MKGGDFLSEDDFWSRWFRRRSLRPFARSWISEDIEDVFREMEDFMAREFGELSMRAPKELVRERTLPSGARVKQWGPFVYGYSMTIGPDGRPQIREFGNIKPETRMGRPRLGIKERREPLADVITTDGEVQVIVELPGVSKEDIDLRGTEESMTVSVDTLGRKYYKKLEMPVKVNPKTAKSKYKNGVLEVTIQKQKKEEEPEGEEIKIE
jgi:HSP20 family protein